MSFAASRHTELLTEFAPRNSEYPTRRQPEKLSDIHSYGCIDECIHSETSRFNLA